MSSILNALRKVESESARADKAQPSLQRKIDAKSVIRSRHPKSRFWGKLLLFVIPVLTLGVALWVVFQYGPFATSKASTAPGKPFQSEQQETTESEVIGGAPDKRVVPDPPQPAYARDKNLPSKPAPERGKPSLLITKPPLAHKEGPSVEDPELKIQAIVWSESPESSFAVINGVIVRAGGKVEGVSVTEIGTDYVSFKSGQRTWKMKMMAE